MATWSVLYEFLRVMTHRSVPARLPFAEAHAFIAELFRSPLFGVLVETDRHAAVVGDVASGYAHLGDNIMHELHTVALMRQHGIRELHTAGKDCTRFRELRVVDPLAA